MRKKLLSSLVAGNLLLLIASFGVIDASADPVDEDQGCLHTRHYDGMVGCQIGCENPDC